MKELQEKDLKYIWHPCSQMKDYEDFPPIVIKKGEGVFLQDVDGKKYFRCSILLVVNLFGHSNKRINDALYRQANKLEHVYFC
jgi:adenosylmethionine-8-amino-7-oxononanoate aminotransferase